MGVHRRFNRWLYGLLALLGLAAVAASIAWAIEELASAPHLGAAEQAGILALPVAVFAMELTAAPVVVWLAEHRKVDLTLAAADLARAVRIVEGSEWARLLGNDSVPIDLKFDFVPSAGRDAKGMPLSGSFRTVVADYQGLRPRRLVITGKAGSGKTVLATELTLGLLRSHSSHDAVPVRLSLSDWDTQTRLADWLTAALADTYDLAPSTVRALVAAGLVVPVLDGLDEMDASPPGSPQVAAGSGPDAEHDGTAPADASTSRMMTVIAQLNDYRVDGLPGALVITCRDDTYLQLEGKLHDSGRARIRPLEPGQAAEYLDDRATDKLRWRPVCNALRAQNPHSVLAVVLDTPWRLNLAFTVYDSDHGPETLLSYTDDRKLHKDLLDQYVPAITRHTGRYDPERVIDWLENLAGYLQINNTTGRRVGHRQLSGSEIFLFELWPMGGIKRVCNIDGLMQIFSFACLSSIFLAAGLLGFHNLVAEGFIIAACSAFIWHRRKRWPESQWVDFRHWPRRIAMWAVLAAGVGVTWWLTRRFSPPTRAPAIPIVVIIILLQAVLPTSRNLPGSIIRPRQLIRNNYTIGLLAGLLFSVAIGFLLGSTTDLIKSAGGFSVLVVISGLGGILAALFIAPLWTRYVAFLLTTRGRVPWTLGRFLDWAANVGLMRMAGTAYQFRHRELQEHLASEFFIKDKPLASTADAQGPSRLSRFAAALAFVAVWAAGIGSINYLGNNTSLRDLQMGTATTDLQPTFNRLNVAAEKHDEVKFLNFVAPALQPRVRLWWENLRRLGLIVSTVYDEAGDGYPPPAAVNSHGNAVQDMGVIAHTGNVANTFTVGSYRIMVHQLPTSKAGQITSWQPLSPAPWDAPVKLYVRNASRVVIATYPDEHAAADAEFSSAVTAANFELSLRSFFPLRQDQFFVFLSENPARRRFSQVASSTPRQTAISNSLADTPSYLSIFPPAYAMADPAFAVGDPISWVISAPPSRSRATIEMISAFSLVGVGPSLVSDDSIPDWVTVGYGRFAEALYLSGTKPSSYSFTWLEKQLAMLPPRMLESRLPTDAELTRGSAAEIAQWSDVAASVYAYISARWGLTSSLNTILGETEGPPAASPLELIQDGSKSSGEAENDWEQWLRSYRR